MAGRTMRTAVLEGVGRVTLQERPVPHPGPGEVLVQVAALGTCGSDVHYYEHGRIGDFVVEPLSVGIWACRKARAGPGSRGLVAGAGPIGLVCLQAAKAFGATYVAISDVNPRRLELARDPGSVKVVVAPQR